MSGKLLISALSLLLCAALSILWLRRYRIHHLLDTRDEHHLHDYWLRARYARSVITTTT